MGRRRRPSADEAMASAGACARRDGDDRVDRGLQYPLGFLGVIALLPATADTPPQRVVAIADEGAAALNFSESVVCAPAVVGGAFFDEVASCIGSLFKSFSWARGGVWEQINGVLSKHGFYYATGYLKPTHHKEMSIDVSGTNFSNLYPKITAQLKKKKKMHYIYFRPDQYKEQEWFNDTIHWFAPKDQDVLEIYATDEETGEKTQIHSFSEFRQWVISHPQKKE